MDKSSTRLTDTEDEDECVHFLVPRDYGSLLFCSRCALQSSARGMGYGVPSGQMAGPPLKCFPRDQCHKLIITPDWALLRMP